MTDRQRERDRKPPGGGYDCVDRIVLNACFGTAYGSGGLRMGRRALTGSGETLDNLHLRGLAGEASERFRR